MALGADPGRGETGADSRVILEDHELETLLSGNKAAWDRFVARAAPVIFGAVRRRLEPAGRLADAEDVAQDVFIKLCKADFRVLKSYDASRARFSTWLTVIASSTAIDHLRRLKRPTDSLDSVPEANLAVDAVEPAWLKIPPDLLSPRQTLVLELLYKKDLTPAEAAEILGVDPQTVRSMHHKALTRLRSHFAEETEG